MTDKPTDKKSNIVAIVKSAQPVNQAGEPDRFADRRIGLLGIENYLLVKYHPARDQSGKSKGNEQVAPLRTEITIPLFLNGVALIESEIVTDDGIIENRYFVIIGKTSTGKLLPPIKVPVNQFPAMNWVFQWGNRLVYAPGNGNKDNARAAIQTLSGDVATSFVYRHTGWRELDGRWHYLTGSGAVTETILDEQVTVELDSGHMQRYRLPAPPEDIRQSAGFATGLLNLAPNNPAVNEVWLEPEKAFSIVKRLSDSQGEPFLISKATLWRRLLERNVLKCVENNTKTGKARPDVKRTVNGISYRVLVFPVTFIIVADV